MTTYDQTPIDDSDRPSPNEVPPFDTPTVIKTIIEALGPETITGLGLNIENLIDSPSPQVALELITALLDHTKFLEAIVASTPPITVLYDSKGNIVNINRSGILNTENNVSGNFENLGIQQEDSLKLIALIKQIFDSGETQTFNIQFNSSNGQLGSYHVLYTLLKGTVANKSQLVLGTYIDITSREQSDVALQKSNDRYQNIAEQMFDFASAYTLDKGGKWTNVWMTDGFTNTTGYSLEEIQNRGGLSSIVYLYDKRIVEETEAMVASGNGKNFYKEFRIISKTGEVIWIRYHWYSKKDDNDDVTTVYTAAYIITTQKKNEEKARLEHDRLTIIMNSSPQSIFLLDLEGRILFFNNVAVDWIKKTFNGLDLRRNKNLKIFDVILPSYFDRFSLSFRQSVRGTNVNTTEKVKLLQGDFFWSDDKFIPVLGPQLETIGVIFTALGVTEIIEGRREIEQQRIKLLRTQFSIDQAKQIVGTIHDFNNLLAGARLRLQMVLEILRDPNFLTTIDNDPHTLSTLIEDIRASEQILSAGTQKVKSLLTLSKAGELNKSNVEPIDLIDMTFGMSRPLGEGIKMEIIKPETELPSIQLDEGLIQSSLQNILINAIYAVRSKGEITDEDGITLKYGQENKDLIIEVKDTGTGISPKNINQIFDFNFTTKGDEGSGFGMPMVKLSIELHGGSIEIVSYTEAEEPGIAVYWENTWKDNEANSKLITQEMIDRDPRYRNIRTGTTVSIRLPMSAG